MYVLFIAGREQSMHTYVTAYVTLEHKTSHN